MGDGVRFRAVVEPARGGGHVVEVDDRAAATIGVKHRSRVRGTLAGAAYRSNLASMGGRLVMGVHKQTLLAAGVSAGDTVDVTMEPDAAPLPDDDVPEALARAMSGNLVARRAWESLAPSHRRRYVGHILQAKRRETRERRIASTIEKLVEGTAR